MKHDWESVVIWITNPAVKNPKIIAVATTKFFDSYKKYRPPPPGTVKGDTTLIAYAPNPDERYVHTVDVTPVTGSTQPLIMWEQMPERARVALTNTKWGDYAKVPFIDVNFGRNLDRAWSSR